MNNEATEVETRQRRHVSTSRPTGKPGPVFPPPARPPRDDRFRAFLGIAIGILGGAALWVLLIQIIRKLA
jgi:hypothetical protein